ncbi:DUF3987 domain-containing protein [Streptomyces wuyuanensis]|uniref:DUF3987 domain-containing protein n=1 Tax=Streptomyces wuyuanensis TaxID=1196353 RepID=UPI003414A22E
MEADHKKFEAMAFGPLGKAVKDAMPHTEADPVGVFAAVLALYSSALNGYVVQPSGRPVVVWTALAGRSAIGRKGFALNTAEKVLSSSIGTFLDIRKRQGVSSGPALITTLYETEQETLVTEDGRDGRTVIVDEEWSTTLKLTNRCPKYAGVLRTSWDGKRISNITKKDGKRVEQTVETPALGFHGHIQPGAWAKYITITEALGGTYNRILPVFTERSKMLPTGDGNPLDAIKPSRALSQAYEWAKKAEDPIRMTLAVNARGRFDEIREEYDNRIGDLPEHIACFIERSAEQVLRVASVLTAASKKTEIGLEALNAAAEFVAYSVRSVEWLVTQPTAGRSQEVKPLDDKIRETLARRGELNRTQLRQALGGRYTAEQVRSMAEEMPDVEVIEQPRTGRPGPAPVSFRLITGEAEPEEAETPAPRPKLAVVPAPRAAAPKKAPARKAVAKAPAKKVTKAPAKKPVKAPVKKVAKKVPESAFSHLI